jgi:hypothetical protein
MAQEISAACSLSITLQGQTASGTTAFKGDLSVGGYLGEEQTIGTTSELIGLVDVNVPPRCLYIRNMDTTNYVEIDSASAMTSFPQHLLPGDACLLLPLTATIYAKANTAPVKIWVVAG